MNSASGKNSKEPSSSTISTEASFNGDSNEETLNVNKTCYHYLIGKKKAGVKKSRQKIWSVKQLVT